MQAEEKSSSDFESNSEAEKIVSSDENSCVVACTSGPVTLQKPVERPTRQWAAWTREEEESFFTALRQVGKNFEKITSRVKSKNKDQVRHYYYRLVRRMNKLLGPTLCLDAKNSKDTNAAMLRWWSLLEKYSCKASKLHLKPRRFKIFVETLEHQLLKDRKKTVRKRTQGENTSPSPTAAPNQSKPSTSDSQPVKMVLVDSQNIQKLGPGKPSFKRNVSFGNNRSNSKGESTSMKQARRRKPGATSSTAYKKWEKAAIAGVSLVADAAEHVERQAADKDVGTSQGQKYPVSVAGSLPPLPPLSRNHVIGSDLQTGMKLKLQLFPIDYNTRKALEMDKHNPHLELTLSTRKKISSVLEHINRKWGSSSVASGELMLFPDTVQRENLMCSRRWSQDSTATAADVYAAIGSLPVFRLRYGWFPSTEAASAPGFGPFVQHQSEMIVEEHADLLPSVNENQVPIPSPANVIGHSDSSTVNQNLRFEGPCDADASMSCYAKLPVPDEGNIRQNEGDGSSIGEWADSLTNISVGDLLTEAAYNEDIDCINSPVIETPQRPQHFSAVCDSFDAAVAAHISKYQSNLSFQSNLSAHHLSSIWDGEETCDAFSFRKTTATATAASLQKQALSPLGSIRSEAKEHTGRTSPEDVPAEVYEVEAATEISVPTKPVVECLSNDQDILKNPVKDFSGLTDIYWPDSLGPFDLDLRSTNYHTEDVILSDSLSCLNRLIANSVDAFQSCSFFGADKKEAEAKGETASLRISGV